MSKCYSKADSLTAKSLTSGGSTINTLCGQKHFNTFQLCHKAEICMPLKLFILKITSNVLIYLIIG